MNILGSVIVERGTSMSEPAEGFEHTATGLERMIKARGATFEWRRSAVSA